MFYFPHAEVSTRSQVAFLLSRALLVHQSGGSQVATVRDGLLQPRLSTPQPPDASCFKRLVRHTIKHKVVWVAQLSERGSGDPALMGRLMESHY